MFLYLRRLFIRCRDKGLCCLAANIKVCGIFLLFLVTPLFISTLEAQASNEKRDFYVAQQSFNDGFYDVAIEKLQVFIENFPESEDMNSARLLLGRAYYKKGDFHLALGEFEKMLSSADLNKKDELHYWMGKLYFDGKDLSLARSSFQKIIDGFPQSDFIGYAYYHLAVIDNISGDYERAKEECGVIIKCYQESDLLEAAYLEMAKSLCGLKKVEESNKILTDFLEKFPQSAFIDRAYFCLGENNYVNFNYRNAIDFYQKARQVNPQGEKTEEALRKEGLAYFELKEYYEAIAVFDELISVNSESAFLEEVTFMKARSFRNLGEDQRAVSVFEELVELEKEREDYGLADDSYFLIADIYYEKGEYEKAAFFYDSFKQKFPQSTLNEEVFYNLGWAYLRLKRYEEAIAEFQQLTQKQMSKDEVLKIIALCRLGDTYLDRGDYQQAVAAYDRVLKDYPDSFYGDYAQYQLAVVFEKIGRLEEAIISLNALVDNFDKSRLREQAYYLMALLYLKKGAYEKSLSAYTKIISDFPNSPHRQLSMLGKGYCYYNLQAFNEALDVFRKFEKVFPNSEYKERAKFEMAQVFFASAKEKEAREVLVQLAKKSSDAEVKDEARLWLAQYDFRRGNYEAARKQFDLLAQESNNHYFRSLAYYWLGKIAYLKGSKQDSLKFLQLASDSNNPVDLKLKVDFEKADVLLELSQFEDALGIYDYMINEYPGSNFALLAYKKKADIKLSQGEFNLARQNYNNALTRIKSDFNAQIQFQIAMTYLREGDLTKALSECFSVVYLYPESNVWKERAQFEAAGIYQKQKKIEAARKIYIELSRSGTEISQLAKNELEVLSDTQDVR